MLNNVGPRFWILGALLVLEEGGELTKQFCWLWTWEKRKRWKGSCVKKDSLSSSILSTSKENFCLLCCVIEAYTSFQAGVSWVRNFIAWDDYKFNPFFEQIHRFYIFKEKLKEYAMIFCSQIKAMTQWKIFYYYIQFNK